MLRVVEKPSEEHQDLRITLDELLRQGALKMLQQALETEVEEYVVRHRAARDERGRAQVVRNGKARARQLVTGTGTMDVRAPRVNDRRMDGGGGQRQRFTSEILPTYMRRAPKVTEVLPILYLRGLSTGDFQAALPVLLGKDAAGLSPTTIHAPHRELGHGVSGLAYAAPVRRGLRVRLGRWSALPRPARGRPALHTGDDWRAARRDEGADRRRRWLSRERRELEHRAA